jgi:hypothetical protein
MPNDDYTDPLVGQLHACLADAMRQSREQPFDSPVSVAEIYQDLVPYRSVRSRLGFEMNADYEHTLLRLLAGEGAYARLEPREARQELQAELEMPNPNVGLFRKFAACDVWVSTPVGGAPAEAARMPAAATAGEPEATVWEDAPIAEVADEQAGWIGSEDPPELLLDEEVDETDIIDAVLYEVPEPARPVNTPAPEPAAVTASEEEPLVAATPRPAAARSTPTPAEEPAVATTVDINGRSSMAKTKGHCAFCDGTLPANRNVRFCPFCGTDQSMIPCSSCREPLDQSWRFCIACGTQSPAVAGAA